MTAPLRYLPCCWCDLRPECCCGCSWIHGLQPLLLFSAAPSGCIAARGSHHRAASHSSSACLAAGHTLLLLDKLLQLHHLLQHRQHVAGVCCHRTALLYT
jgi:hypothetical protein